MNDLPKILCCGFYDSSVHQPDLKKSEPRRVDFFELELFKTNSGISVLNGIKYPLKTGSLLFSKPSDIRYSYLHFQTYYIHFTVKNPQLKAILRDLPSFIDSSESKKIKDHFTQIIQSYYSSSVLEKFRASAELISLLSLINNFAENELSSHDTIKKAKSYIERNYSDDITVKSIADYCNISETHLYRIFRNSLGISPNDYLSDIRLSASRKLLCSTELSIGEIALSCGFNSQSYFSNCFKQKHSISPTKFRTSHHYSL